MGVADICYINKLHSRICARGRKVTMKKTEMTAQGTFNMDSAKAAFNAIETVATAGLFEASTEKDNIQFGHKAHEGVNGNDGFICQYGEGAFKAWSKKDVLFELWDNSAENTPNIAIRPSKTLRDKLPLATWKKFGCVRNFTQGGKNEFTFRIRAYKSDSDLMVILARLIAESVKECRRREKAEKAAKKAVTKKVTEKANSKKETA